MDRYVDFNSLINGDKKTPLKDYYLVPGAVAWLSNAVEGSRVVVHPFRQRKRWSALAMRTVMVNSAYREFGADHPLARIFVTPPRYPISFVVRKPKAPLERYRAA
jgi:hypothetical protein